MSGSPQQVSDSDGCQHQQKHAEGDTVAISQDLPMVYCILRNMGLWSTADALRTELEEQQRQQGVAAPHPSNNRNKGGRGPQHPPATAVFFAAEGEGEDQAQQDGPLGNSTGPGNVRTTPPSSTKDPLLSPEAGTEQRATPLQGTRIGWAEPAELREAAEALARFTTAPLNSCTRGRSSSTEEKSYPDGAFIGEEEAVVAALAEVYHALVSGVVDGTGVTFAATAPNRSTDRPGFRVSPVHRVMAEIFLHYSDILLVQMLLAEFISLDDIQAGWPCTASSLSEKDSNGSPCRQAASSLNNNSNLAPQHEKGRKRGRRRTSDENASTMAHYFSGLPPSATNLYASRLGVEVRSLQSSLAKHRHILAAAHTSQPPILNNVMRYMARLLPAWTENTEKVVQWMLHRSSHPSCVAQGGGLGSAENSKTTSRSVATGVVLPSPSAQAVLEVLLAGLGSGPVDANSSSTPTLPSSAAMHPPAASPLPSPSALAENVRGAFMRILHVVGRARLVLWLLQSIEECVREVWLWESREDPHKTPDASFSQGNPAPPPQQQGPEYPPLWALNSWVVLVQSHWATSCALQLKGSLMSAEVFLQHSTPPTPPPGGEGKPIRGRRTPRASAADVPPLVQGTALFIDAGPLRQLWSYRVTELKDAFKALAANLLLSTSSTSAAQGHGTAASLKDQSTPDLQRLWIMRSTLCRPFLSAYAKFLSDPSGNGARRCWPGSDTNGGPRCDADPSALGLGARLEPKMDTMMHYANVAAPTLIGSPPNSGTLPSPFSRREEQRSPPTGSLGSDGEASHTSSVTRLSPASLQQVQANIIAIHESLACGRVVDSYVRLPPPLPLRQRIRKALRSQRTLLHFQSDSMPVALQLRMLQHPTAGGQPRAPSRGKRRSFIDPSDHQAHRADTIVDTANATPKGSPMAAGAASSVQSEGTTVSSSSDEMVRVCEGDTFVAGEAVTNRPSCTAPTLIGVGQVPSVLQSPLFSPRRRSSRGRSRNAAVVAAASSPPATLARRLAIDIATVIERVIFSSELVTAPITAGAAATISSSQHQLLSPEDDRAITEPLQPALSSPLRDLEDEDEVSSSDDRYNDPRHEVMGEVQQLSAAPNGQLFALVTTRARLVVFALRLSPRDEGYQEVLLVDERLPGSPSHPYWYDMSNAVVQFSNDSRFVLASVQYTSPAVPEGEEEGRAMWPSTGNLCVYSLHDSETTTATTAAGATPMPRNPKGTPLAGRATSPDAVEDTIRDLFPLTNHLYGDFAIHDAPVVAARWVEPHFWGGGWAAEADVIAAAVDREQSFSQRYEPTPDASVTGPAVVADGEDVTWRTAACARLAAFQCLSAGMDQVLVRWLPSSGIVLQRLLTAPLQDLAVSYLMSAVYTIDDEGHLSMYDAWNEAQASDPVRVPRPATLVRDRGLPDARANLCSSAQTAVDRAQRVEQPDADPSLPKAFFTGTRIVQFDRGDVIPHSHGLRTEAASSSGSCHRAASSGGVGALASRIFGTGRANAPGTATRTAAQLGRQLIQEALSESAAESHRSRPALLDSSEDEDTPPPGEGLDSVHPPRRSQRTPHGCGEDGMAQNVQYKSDSRLVFTEVKRALCHAGSLKTALHDPRIGPGGMPYHLLSMSLSGEPKWAEAHPGGVGEDEVAYWHRIRLCVRLAGAPADRKDHSRHDAPTAAQQEDRARAVRYYADDPSHPISHALGERRVRRHRTGYTSLAPTARNGRYLCIMASVGPYRCYVEHKKPLEMFPGFYACLVFDTYTSHVLRVIPVCPVQPTPALTVNGTMPSHHDTVKTPFFSLQCSVTVVSGACEAPSHATAGPVGSPAESQPVTASSPDDPRALEDTVLVAVGGLHNTVHFFNALTGECFRRVILDPGDRGGGGGSTPEAPSTTRHGLPLQKRPAASPFAAAQDVIASVQRWGQPAPASTPGLSPLGDGSDESAGATLWWLQRDERSPQSGEGEEEDSVDGSQSGSTSNGQSCHKERDLNAHYRTRRRLRRQAVLDQLIRRHGPAMVMQGYLDVVRVLPSSNVEYTDHGPLGAAVAGQPQPLTGAANTHWEVTSPPYGSFLTLMGAGSCPGQDRAPPSSRSLRGPGSEKLSLCGGDEGRAVGAGATPFQFAALQQDELQRALEHITQQHTRPPLESDPTSPKQASSSTSLLPSFLLLPQLDRSLPTQPPNSVGVAQRSTALMRAPVRCSVVNAVALWWDEGCSGGQPALHALVGNEGGKLFIIGGPLTNV